MHSGWQKTVFVVFHERAWAEHDVDEELLADHLSGSSWRVQGIRPVDRDEELISHSVHNESEVNAESMFVLAFNIRARISAATENHDEMPQIPC